MGVAGIPGKGGPSRGRADAELTWRDEVSGRTDSFDAEQLPDASVLDSESTGVVGVAATSPTVEPSAEGAGAADVRASAGRSAWKRRLAPRHREAVQGFFGGGKDDR